MTLYLLDENVLKEMTSGGNANVRKWAATVPDSDLRMSVMTFFEKRNGWHARLRVDPQDRAAAIRLAAVEKLEGSYGDRLLSIDARVVAEWTRLLGAKRKNQIDVALAATARVHGLVVATRNVTDFLGRGVDVLDPFQDPPRFYPAKLRGTRQDKQSDPGSGISDND